MSFSAGAGRVWSVAPPVVVPDVVVPDVLPDVPGVIMLSGVIVVPDVVVPDVVAPDDRGPTGPVISG